MSTKIVEVAELETLARKLRKLIKDKNLSLVVRRVKDTVVVKPKS